MQVLGRDRQVRYIIHCHNNVQCQAKYKPVTSPSHHSPACDQSFTFMVRPGPTHTHTPPTFMASLKPTWESGGRGPGGTEREVMAELELSEENLTLKVVSQPLRLCRRNDTSNYWIS